MKRMLEQPGMARPSKAKATAARQPQSGHRPGGFDLRKVAIHRSEVAPAVVARSLSTPSEPIPAALSARFASAFGASPSRVRVHRGALAAEAAATIGASAFTVGRHVVMGDGDTATLAHELVHAAQQGVAEPHGGALPIASANDASELAADRGARNLLAGAPVAISPAPVQVARAPRLHVTIVGVGTTVSVADQQRIVDAAKKSLAATTKSSDDPRIKAGVDVTYQNGLKGSEALRKRGDIVVYVIDGAKTDDKRDAAVRDVLHARGWETDQHNRSKQPDKLADETSRISSMLHDDRGLFDHTTGASIVDISDLREPLTQANDTSIAGTVLHEGVGHPATLEHHGKHVMSTDAPNKAEPSEIEFDTEDQKAVNEYLKMRLDTPDWDYK
jgi:hypothetical protein